MTEKRERETPDTMAGIEVRPGDTLVLVVQDHDAVDEETVDGWVREVRKRLPEGADVLFVCGVTPVVVRGTGRCPAETDDWQPGRGSFARQCQRPHGHPGRHQARWDTGSVSWG